MSVGEQADQFVNRVGRVNIEDTIGDELLRHRGQLTRDIKFQTFFFATCHILKVFARSYLVSFVPLCPHSILPFRHLSSTLYNQSKVFEVCFKILYVSIKQDLLYRRYFKFLNMLLCYITHSDSYFFYSVTILKFNLCCYMCIKVITFKCWRVSHALYPPHFTIHSPIDGCLAWLCFLVTTFLHDLCETFFGIYTPGN